MIWVLKYTPMTGGTTTAKMIQTSENIKNMINGFPEYKIISMLVNFPFQELMTQELTHAAISFVISPKLNLGILMTNSMLELGIWTLEFNLAKNGLLLMEDLSFILSNKRLKL